MFSSVNSSLVGAFSTAQKNRQSFLPLFLIAHLCKDDWLNKTVSLLYEEADFLSLLAESSAIVEQRKGALMFGPHLCPNNDDQHCLLSIMKVQNFLSMVLKLKIQEKLVEGNVFYGSSSVTVEQSSGTSLCISIDPSKEGYKSQSGIGNGIEAIIDLETFDNGDTQIVGDGADVLMTQSVVNCPTRQSLLLSIGSLH